MNLSSKYEPQGYEADIYKLWQSSGTMEPSGEGEPFCIIMPPPNANAALHIGTATYVKQDAKARYERMRGKDVLYLPGADHAGFETWYVYEKYLASLGKTKFDFTNKELYDAIWDFVQENMQNAKNSYRRLGLSCSWDNFTFTLDDKVTKNVKRVFKQMFEEGLVYRGKRLVNYCTHHQTSFSDIEVEYENQNSPLYYMQYGPFQVATTRPETKFGDTAVAVHPDDERYQQYIGQEITVDGLNGPFKLKVIADEMVDRAFGTGAVKITPAHDFNDFEVAERHNLDAVEVIGKDGKMLPVAGKYAGLTVKDARKQIVKDLKSKGLLVKVEKDYDNRVGACYKCHTVIEPLLMDQWFVSMEPLAKKAIDAIKSDKIKFTPANRKEIAIDYLKNIKDWNISRQIPWGISIPAFYNEELDKWVYSDSEEDEIQAEGKVFKRDTDVFDTWMSSSQWPYLTLDWPDGDNYDQMYKKFYPTSWIHLGREIFPQWGLRMIMMGLYSTGEVPWKEIYVNGNIRAADGKKMSKSLSNTIPCDDILDEHGSDSLRIGLLLTDSSPGSDKSYDPSKVILGRNFSNKLWNIARYTQNLLDEAKLHITETDEPILKSSADHWIANQLSIAINQVEQAMDKSDFAAAFEAVYDLTWNKFADWYLEASKAAKDGSKADGVNLSVLTWALEVILRLTHPFAPFVSETIWQSLGFQNEESLLITEQIAAIDLSALGYEPEQTRLFKEIMHAVTAAHQVKSYLGHNKIIVSSDDHGDAGLAARIAGLSDDAALVGGDYTSKIAIANLAQWNLLVSVEDLQAYRDKIGERIDQVQEKILHLESRLANPSYINNAPPQLVAESRAEIESLNAELTELKS